MFKIGKFIPIQNFNWMRKVQRWSMGLFIGSPNSFRFVENTFLLDINYKQYIYILGVLRN